VSFERYYFSRAVSRTKHDRALQAAKKFDAEGGGGFNPRIKLASCAVLLRILTLRMGLLTRVSMHDSSVELNSFQQIIDVLAPI
jgi:hypothetical protein